MPKSLSKFYFKFGFLPCWGNIVLWALCSIIGRIVFYSGQPIADKWFFSLFDGPVPAGASVLSFALPVIAAVFAVYMIAVFAHILEYMFFPRIAGRSGQNLSVVLYKYINSQSMEFFLATQPGKIGNQAENIAKNFTDIIWNLVFFTVMLASITINMGMVFSISRTIAVLIFGVVLFRALFTGLLLKRIMRLEMNFSESKSMLAGKLMDNLSNFIIVKLFAGAPMEERFVRPHRENTVRARIESKFWLRVGWAVPWIIETVFFGLILYFCASSYMSGAMLVSEIVLALMVWKMNTEAITYLSDNISNFIEYIGDARQSWKKLVAPIAVADAPDAANLNVTSGAVEIRNVSFKYKKKFVLDNLSITISPGEKVGLVGSSGAGKTTLVNLLMRLYDPTHGEIL
ncbi:MAG: ABC transporter ATP-binding protein/permease, partial [Rickettsiales bacterium]|nr:ABC transporter ATP-binding protein/permease [Rickettsiales bacterium]